MTRDEKTPAPAGGETVQEGEPSPQPTYEMVGGKLVIRFPQAQPPPGIRVNGQVFGMDEGPSVLIGGRKFAVGDLF